MLSNPQLLFYNASHASRYIPVTVYGCCINFEVVHLPLVKQVNSICILFHYSVVSNYVYTIKFLKRQLDRMVLGIDRYGNTSSSFGGGGAKKN